MKTLKKRLEEKGLLNEVQSKVVEVDKSKITNTNNRANLSKSTINNMQKVNTNLNNSEITKQFNQAYKKDTWNRVLNRTNQIMNDTKYVGKKTGAGVISGLTGIPQAIITDTANQMQKGQNNKSFKNIQDLIISITNPKLAIAKSMAETAKENNDILKDKDKNFIEKLSGIATNTVSDASNVIVPGKQQINSLNKLIGGIVPQADEQLLELNEKISEPSKKINEKLEQERSQHGKVAQTLGDVGQVVGNMVPSIATSVVTKNPTLGLATMGVSAKGQSTQEALDKGANLDEAVRIGDTKAMIEIGTEMLTSGVNIFGKGAFDDLLEKGIVKKVENEVARFLVKQGVNIAGETVEETVSDLLGTLIDKGTVDKNANYSLKDWGETALTTLLSTTILNILTGGMVGDISSAQNRNNLRDNLQQNSTNLTQEQLNSTKKDITQGKIETQEQLNQKLSEYGIKQATTIENKPISEQSQQVILNEGKIAENGTSQEISNIEQNEKKITENTKNNKQKQLEIIQKTNSMQDDYHVGIRNVEDIKTFEEAIQDDESFVWGDYSKEDAERDLQKGTVTVYSSRPIEDGAFVSTSKNQAQDYAGSGQVYSQEVSIDDVAWINGDEGQFAKIETPNIENNQQTMYNDFESEGVLNGKEIDRKTQTANLGGDNVESNLFEKRKQKQIAEKQYREWERSIVPKTEKELTKQERILKEEFKKNQNKDIVFIKGDNGKGYNAGASLDNPDIVYINTEQSEKFGLYRTAYHETMESNIRFADETNKDIIVSAINDVLDMDVFEKQKQEFWKDQEGEIPSDSAIAKDIICDRFAELNGEKVDYEIYDEIKDRIDFSIEYFNEKNSTESSFSMQKNVREDGLLDARTETTTKNVKKKTLNPTEISNLTIEDASSTPKLIGKKKARGNKQSNFLKNITVKSRFLNQEFRNELTEEDNIRYYNGISNIDTLNKAYDDLQAEGQKGTLEWFNKDSSQATAEDTAKGWILLKQYQDAGDFQSAVEVAKKMREIGTSAGQTIQAFNILSRLTPNGMFYYAQKELSEIYSEMSKGKTKEWIDKHKTDFDLTPIETQFIKDTMEEVATMDDGYEKKAKLAEIQKLITNKIPPTAGKSIKSWMRISMLFNPKTQVRNVLGNAVTLPVNLFSDMFSTAVDKAIAKKTGKRTTGMVNLKEYGKGFGKGLYESYNDFKKGINTKEIQGNRFEVTDGKSFKDEGIGKALNFTDNVLNFVMDAGDRSFYEATFTNSINNQLVLNNTTEVTQEIIDIATQEALSRTWQDDNAYTQAVLTIRNALNGKIGKNKGLAYGLGDVIIPFAKTPANLTKAIVDYSPVGLVKTLAIDAKKFANSLENGQYDAKQQHKFVQNLGKGMAGSLLYVLGYALANAGIISGEADEDKDVKNFMKNSLGIGSYSIKIGDKSFAYDWAQPIATPLAIMSNYVKYSKNNPDASAIDKAINAINIGTEQLLEQSFMESINTVLNGNGTTLENLTQAVMELPSRAIPTFSKQIADLVDSTQRTTFEYGKPVKSAVNAVVAKIPGLSKTLPAQVDTFGNEIQKYGGDNSVFNVFFNPANMNKGTLTKAGQEIYNLYRETGNTAIFPRTAPYYINNKNEKVTMDAQQRADFQKVTGQYVQKNLNYLLDNKQYLSLNADERAKFLEEVVADSYSKAKYEILGIESEDGAKKREKIENVGEKTYYDFNIRLDKLQREKERNNETVKDSEKIEILHDSTYNKDTKSKVYEYMLGGNKDDVYNSLKQLTSNKVTINDYLGYKTADLSADKKDDGTKNGKSISGSAKKKLLDFLNNSNLSYIERLYIYGTKYPNLTSAQKTSLINKIKSLNLTSEEQKQIYLELKDVEELSDGRIRWK